MTKQQTTIYLPEELRKRIDSHVDNEGLSRNEWIETALREQLQEQQLDRASDRYRVEQKLLRMVEISADRAAEKIVNEIADELDHDPGESTADDYVTADFDD
jgi:metal-responsive CopG/Arc/MetJ family transcriptional regulator